TLKILAELYYYQGRYDQAKELLVEALEQRKLLLGEEHPSVVTSLNNLASLYDSQGRHDQAEPLYLQALEICQHLLETYPEY
ncbi:tetratricopeptide repeat protein, partial [Nostoc sp. CALU 1950]|uniref:tetratricopeptide repeat protein n=1 Tax=Nostoc sp. CALU 1950 TaxID=3104321 RepID=UPI003EBF8D25